MNTAIIVPSTTAITTISIYALLCPRTFQPKYIGKTHSALSKRLSQHLAPTKLGRRTPLAAWLRGLVTEGQTPLVALLQRVSQDDARDAEIHWIKQYRADGHNLTNQHAGGTGPNAGYTWGMEGLKRLSAAKRKGQDATSVYRGVSRHRPTGKWQARFRGEYLGLYDQEEEAAVAYGNAYRELFGENVPMPTIMAPMEQSLRAA